MSANDFSGDTIQPRNRDLVPVSLRYSIAAKPSPDGKRQVGGLQSIRNEISSQEGEGGDMIGFVLSCF